MYWMHIKIFLFYPSAGSDKLGKMIDTVSTGENCGITGMVWKKQFSLHEKLFFGYSIQTDGWATYNEYPQHMFGGKIRKISIFGRSGMQPENQIYSESLLHRYTRCQVFEAWSKHCVDHNFASGSTVMALFLFLFLINIPQIIPNKPKNQE